MKRIIGTLFLFTMVMTLATAQSRVQAVDIINQLNQGEAVQYDGVTIVGTLDLTDLNNREQTESSNGRFGGNDTYESHVEADVTFTNCKFTDDVLAYYHDEDEEATYIAHFDENAQFSQCIFEGKSEFKYSEFSETADFQRTAFQEEANFKYSEFSESPDFSSTTFNRDANFKYAEFPKNTTFAGAAFEEEANFKYADFPAGASFAEASFNDLANFKYSKFREPLNLDNVAFNGSEDFKYTEVDGKDFSSYPTQQ